MGFPPLPPPRTKGRRAFARRSSDEASSPPLDKLRATEPKATGAGLPASKLASAETKQLQTAA